MYVLTTEQSKRIEQLYLEMFDLLMTYARSSLENESLAEEAIQETFRIACLKPEDLLNSPNPKGWLINTLKNTIRNIKRSRTNANKLLATYLAVQSSDIAFSEDKISLEVTYANIASSEEFKLIKEMAVDGKSHLEMAQSRGISVDACKKRVQRAKELLRRKI